MPSSLASDWLPAVFVPLNPPMCPFPLFWEGSPTKIDYRKRVPYSNLSTGGPSLPPFINRIVGIPFVVAFSPLWGRLGKWNWGPPSPFGRGDICSHDEEFCCPSECVAAHWCSPVLAEMPCNNLIEDFSSKHVCTQHKEGEFLMLPFRVQSVCSNSVYQNAWASDTMA